MSDADIAVRDGRVPGRMHCGDLGRVLRGHAALARHGGDISNLDGVRFLALLIGIMFGFLAMIVACSMAEGVKEKESDHA